MRWFAVMLLVSCMAQAQYAGNAPTVVQAYQTQTIGSTANVLVMPADVTNGNLEVVCVDVGEGTANTYTISSTRVPSWTTLSPITDVVNQLNFQMYYGLATSSGQETITLPTTGGKDYSTVAAEYAHVSGTVDVSASQNLNGTPKTATTSLTTTVNTDVIVTCTGALGATTLVPTDSQYISMNNENLPVLMSMTQTGTKGAYTVTNHNQNQQLIAPVAWSVTMIQQSVAFKPTPTLAVTTTLLPDADLTQAYKATLTAAGGTAAYTWTQVSGTLPTGLTFHTATGVIDGTCTAASTQSVVFHVTDGTTTSADVTLSLKCGTRFGIPILHQSQHCDSTGGSPTCTLPGPVNNGDTILILAHGFDTHGSNGWVPPVTDPGNTDYISDTLGSTWRRGCPIGGTNSAPLIAYAATAIASGTEAVTFNSTANGSNLTWIVFDIANGQAVLDCGGTGESDTIITTHGSASWSTAASVTTQVLNELLLTASFESTVFGFPAPTFSFSAPISLISAQTGIFDFSGVGSDAALTASSYTATANYTDTQAEGTISATSLFAIRPGLSLAGTFAGEKRRRQIY